MEEKIIPTKHMICFRCGYEWISKIIPKQCPKCKRYNYQYNNNYELGICQICKKQVDEICIHHIIPKRLGGTNDINNLMQLCRPCHIKIHNKR
jgi:5-methylcytosine-specific restriction endonuclease McrA